MMNAECRMKEQKSVRIPAFILHSSFCILHFFAFPHALLTLGRSMVHGCSLWSFTARQPIRGRCYGEHRPLFTGVSGPITSHISTSHIEAMIALTPQTSAALPMTDVVHSQSRPTPGGSAFKRRFVWAGLVGSALLIALIVGWPLIQNYRANWGVVVPGKMLCIIIGSLRALIAGNAQPIQRFKNIVDVFGTAAGSVVSWSSMRRRRLPLARRTKSQVSTKLAALPKCR